MSSTDAFDFIYIVCKHSKKITVTVVPEDCCGYWDSGAHLEMEGCDDCLNENIKAKSKVEL